jgi:nickel superoxide dismutase
MSVNENLPVAEAHCDGPCGVYDPASARIAAEAAVSMTKKMNALEVPSAGDQAACVAYNNTMSRYIAIKEEQAHIAKLELLVLWTDYFKPPHLEKYPDLHEKVWKACQLGSAVKIGVNMDTAVAFKAALQEIGDIFWETKA